MKVLFIYPDIIGDIDYTGTYYTGIGSLSSELRKFGHTTALIHITQDVDREKLISEVKESAPDLIAFSSTTNMFPYVEKYSDWIKATYDVPIVVGGIHPTLYPKEVISCKSIDMLCRGDGEITLAELCESFIGKDKEIMSISGLWVKKGGKVYKSPIRPLIGNLDSLEFPDREIFDIKNMSSEKDGGITMMASRGCPFSCAYCCNSVLRNLYKDEGVKTPPVRFRSVSHLLAEIKQVMKTYPFIRRVSFEDDVLPLNKRWFEEFAVRYFEEVGLPFTCNLYPGLADRRIFELLKEAGCISLRMGIESGNDFVRSQLLNRKLTSEQIVEAFRLCDEFGIHKYSFNMVGFPDETMEKMLDTVKLNAKVRSNFCQVSIFYPYRGSSLYNVCKDKKLLSDSKSRNYFSRTVLNFNTIKKTQIIFVRAYFRILVLLYMKFSSRPNFVGFIDRLLLSWASSIIFFPMLNRCYTIFTKYRALHNIARRIKKRLEASITL